MTITKTVDIGEREVEVHVSSEDIANALAWEIAHEDKEQFETERNVFHAVNLCARFLRGIPDSIIANAAPSSRKVIADFLREQLARFDQ